MSVAMFAHVSHLRIHHAAMVNLGGHQQTRAKRPEDSATQAYTQTGNLWSSPLASGLILRWSEGTLSTKLVLYVASILAWKCLFDCQPSGLPMVWQPANIQQSKSCFRQSFSERRPGLAELEVASGATDPEVIGLASLGAHGTASCVSISRHIYNAYCRCVQLAEAELIPVKCRDTNTNKPVHARVSVFLPTTVW